MPVETMITNNVWPSLNESNGKIISTEATNSNNNEWEMIAENSENDTANNGRHVVILPSSDNMNTSKETKGRPRSATVGGEAVAAESDKVLKECESFGEGGNKDIDVIKAARRSFRRCASTPDLLMSDNDHEVIVEDESDDDEDEVSTSEEGDSGEEDETVEEDFVRAQKIQEEWDGEESFEVLSEKTTDTRKDQKSEIIVADEDVSKTTSSWTLISATTCANPTPSTWGSSNAPSFKDILAKNADKPMSWGCDKEKTEAMLRDSHRRHHLRVRTKPKFIIAENVQGSGMMKHAHSTGDLTKMMEMADQGRERAGRHRMKKQFSALMEEEDEGDFVIGSGSGGGFSGGGGGDTCGVDVLGDTDAMDFYHQKEKGSQSTHNKKKERPDEAKRKEISMYKKELQREKQQLRSKGGANQNTEEGGKKKKNEKGFGGKKERRRL